MDCLVIDENDEMKIRGYSSFGEAIKELEADYIPEEIVGSFHIEEGEVSAFGLKQRVWFPTIVKDSVVGYPFIIWTTEGFVEYDGS